MEQQRYGFNKEQGTKGTAKRAAISLPFYLFHIWPGRVKAHHIFFMHVTQAAESVVTLLRLGQKWPGAFRHRIHTDIR